MAPEAQLPAISLPEGDGSRADRRIVRIVTPLLRRVMRAKAEREAPR